MSGVRAAITAVGCLIVLVYRVEFALGRRAEIVGTHLVHVGEILVLRAPSCLERCCLDVGVQLVL